MTKTLINIFLIISFACLAIIIRAPFIAEARFDAAERLIAGYMWKDAEKRLGEVIKIDPYDSRYPARLGEFLFSQSGYKDNNIPLLNKAEEYYGRASGLNPRCAEYFTKQGQINLAIFLEDPSSMGLIRRAFANFKKAIEDDPNGFNTAYAVGYSSLSAWKYLNESEKGIAIDRLRYSLKQKPWYSEYIYPHILRETQYPELLERIMPEVMKKRWVDVDKIANLKSSASKTNVSNVILKSDWQGAGLSENNIYKDGNMYWSGTIYGAMLFPKGSASINVEAKASQADGVYPCMLVSLDGERAGSAYVDGAEFKEYSFSVNTDGGVKVLGVTFTNDGGNKNEDRNLYVGKARVREK